MSQSIDMKSFVDNPAVKDREAKFMKLDVKVGPVIASWRDSIFAHEWLDSEGRIKKPSEMVEKMKAKREAIENQISSGAALERPVLGIGIMDNIEIGSGKDLFLCLAAMGMTTIPVHIPKSNEKDFRMFIR
jgi:hypothetical protein